VLTLNVFDVERRRRPVVVEVAEQVAVEVVGEQQPFEDVVEPVDVWSW
jgi:hypothetical protein